MNYISSSELKFQWFTFCWLISMDNYAVMKNTFGVPSKCYNIFILCQLQKKIAAFHKFMYHDGCTVDGSIHFRI